MILFGYIEPYSNYSFSIPLYTNGSNTFYHELSSDLRIENFVNCNLENISYIKIDTLIEATVGDHGVIIFIDGNGESIINFSNLIVPIIFNLVSPELNKRKNLLSELQSIYSSVSELSLAENNLKITHKPQHREHAIDLVFQEQSFNETSLVNFLAREKTIRCRNIFVLSDKVNEKRLFVNTVQIYFFNNKAKETLILDRLNSFYELNGIKEPESMLVANNVLSELKDGELYYFIDNFQNSSSDFHICAYEKHYKSLRMNKREYLMKVLDSSTQFEFPMQIFHTKTILNSIDLYSVSGLLMPSILRELWKIVLKKNISRQVTFLELKSDKDSYCFEPSFKSKISDFFEKISNTLANILYK